MMRTVLLGLAIAGLSQSASAQTIVNSFPHQGAFAGGLEYTGNIWVADETNDIINEYDRSGNLLQSIPAPPPPGSGLLNPQPIGVGYDPNTGNLWIGDEGEWYYEMTTAGVTTGRSFPTQPTVIDVSGVAVDPANGNIFISQDSSPRQIVEFDQNGSVVSIIDLSASGSTDPDGLAYNPATDTFLLGEDATDRIIEVDRSGAFLNSWDMGALGISPEGLGVDVAAGTVFVGDGFVTITVFEIAGIISGGCTGPTLSISNLIAGGTATATLDCGTPGGVAYFAYSLAGGGPTMVNGGPCGALTLDLSNPIAVLPPVLVDPNGSASVMANVPPGTTGVNVWAQAFDFASCALTPGLNQTIL